MTTTELTGYIAAALITAANIPQAYVIIRDKSTSNISVITYGMLFVGGGSWVTYGVLKDDLPIIFCNSISTLTCAVILALYFSSSKAINKIHKAILPKKIKDEAKKQGNSKK